MMTIKIVSLSMCVFLLAAAAGCGGKSFRRIAVHRDYSRGELVVSGQSHTKPPATHENIFIWPLDEFVFMSPFGIRRGRRHDGVDLAAPSGRPVRAAADGRVVFSGRMRGYGNLVLIKHDHNYFTAYAHNRRNLKRKGCTVKQGEVIAQVGRTGRATGNHVHFEIRKGRRAMDPLDFLPAQAGVIVKKGTRVKRSRTIASKRPAPKKSPAYALAPKTPIAKKRKISSKIPAEPIMMHDDYDDDEVLPKEIKLPSSGSAMNN